MGRSTNGHLQFAPRRTALRSCALGVIAAAQACGVHLIRVESVPPGLWLTVDAERTGGRTPGAPWQPERWRRWVTVGVQSRDGASAMARFHLDWTPVYFAGVVAVVDRVEGLDGAAWVLEDQYVGGRGDVRAILPRPGEFLITYHLPGADVAAEDLAVRVDGALVNDAGQWGFRRAGCVRVPAGAARVEYCGSVLDLQVAEGVCVALTGSVPVADPGLSLVLEPGQFTGSVRRDGQVLADPADPGGQTFPGRSFDVCLEGDGRACALRVAVLADARLGLRVTRD